MNDFTVVNIACRAALTIIMAIGLLRYGDRLNTLQRFGMGLIGGSAFMTIPILLDIDRRGTPFDGWATTLITVGCIMFAIGTMWRIEAHTINNQRMVNRARQHFAGRGGDI